MRYRTIVADPPWPYTAGWNPPGGQGEAKSVRDGVVVPRKPKPLPYTPMTLDEIRALPIRDLVDPEGAHVYMWTTNRYMPVAYDIFRAWGVRYGETIVWCKTPMGGALGGDFTISTEFCLRGRIGSLKRLGSRVESTWFNWPRMDRQHSRKPEAFMDMVEQVSPGPYLELFARRQRLGWDTWGNEALNHVEIAS